MNTNQDTLDAEELEIEILAVKRDLDLLGERIKHTEAKIKRLQNGPIRPADVEGEA